MINTVAEAEDEETRKLRLLVTENICNNFPDHVVFQGLSSALRAFNKDGATNILTQFGLRDITQSFIYNDEEIFLMACFVNRMIGMEINLWEDTTFGEFVAAHRG